MSRRAELQVAGARRRAPIIAKLLAPLPRIRARRAVNVATANQPATSSSTTDDGWSAVMRGEYVHVENSDGLIVVFVVQGEHGLMFSHAGVRHDVATAITRLGSAVADFAQPTREELRQAKRVAFACLSLGRAESWSR